MHELLCTHKNACLVFAIACRFTPFWRRKTTSNPLGLVYTQKLTYCLKRKEFVQTHTYT